MNARFQDSEALSKRKGLQANANKLAKLTKSFRHY